LISKRKDKYTEGLEVDAEEWIRKTGGEVTLLESGVTQKATLNTLVAHAKILNPELAGVLFAADDGMSLFVKSPHMGGAVILVRS